MPAGTRAGATRKRSGVGRHSARHRRRVQRSIDLRSDATHPWLVRLVVAAALVGNVALACYHLGGRSIWTDEVTSWLVSGQNVGTIVSSGASDGGHLIGYYLAVHLSIQLFGAGPDALRGPSVVFGAAAVPLLYLLGRRLAGATTAAGATALFAVSMPLVYWEQNARAYSLVVLLAVATTLCAVVAVQSGRTWVVLLWAVLSAVASYTHEEGVLLFVAQLIPVLACRYARLVRLPFIVATAVLVGIGLPATLHAVHHPEEQDFVNQPGWHVLREVLTFLASAAGTPRGQTAVDYALLAITAAVWVGLAVALARRPAADDAFAIALVLSCLAVPTVLAYGYSEISHPVLVDRYVIVSLPAASLAVAMALARLRPRAVGVYGLVYLTAFRMGVLAPTYDVPQDTYAEATSYVVAHTNAGDCIVFEPELAALGWDYYARRQPGGAATALPAQTLPSERSRAPLAQVEEVGGFDGQEISGARSPANFRIIAGRCTRVWLYVRYGPGTKAATGRASLAWAKHELHAEYQRSRIRYFRDISVTVFAGSVEPPTTGPLP